MQLAFRQGMGRDIAIKLMKAEKAEKSEKSGKTGMGLGKGTEAAAGQ